MIIYKADLKTNIYYLVVFVILFGVTVALSSKFLKTNWPILVIFLLLFVAFNLITSRLYKIQLDKINSSLTLIHKNYIGVKRILKYDLKQIEFTYKKQATSFRGGIKNVCTIYSFDKKVIHLVPGNDDWSDNEIRNLVYGLIDLNVKKKFIGNSLNDVET